MRAQFLYEYIDRRIWSTSLWIYAISQRTSNFRGMWTTDSLTYVASKLPCWLFQQEEMFSKSAVSAHTRMFFMRFISDRSFLHILYQVTGMLSASTGIIWNALSWGRQLRISAGALRKCFRFRLLKLKGKKMVRSVFRWFIVWSVLQPPSCHSELEVSLS